MPRISGFVFLICFSSQVFANQVDESNWTTFEANKTAKAAEVNNNFNALRTAVNDNASVINQLVSLGLVPNLLSNGGFEISWDSPAPNATPLAKWWFTGGSMEASQNTNPDNVLNGNAAIIAKSADGGFLYQAVENVDAVRGKIVTVTVSAKVGASGAAVIIDDGVAQSSRSLSVQAGYQTLSFTHSVDAEATYLAVQLHPKDTESFFENVGLYAIDAAAGIQFTASEAALENIRIERWYERATKHIYNNDLYENNNNSTNLVIRFRTQKANAVSMLTTNTYYYCSPYVSINGVTAALSVGKPGTPGNEGGEYEALIGVSDSFELFLGGGSANTFVCDNSQCTMRVETGGIVNLRECFINFDWQAFVPETTY